MSTELVLQSISRAERRARPRPAPAEPEWRAGMFVGGPAHGEQGPTDGDRVTVIRDGVLYRYALLAYRAVDGSSLRAWIYAGYGTPA